MKNWLIKTAQGASSILVVAIVASCTSSSAPPTASAVVQPAALTQPSPATATGRYQVDPPFTWVGTEILDYYTDEQLAGLLVELIEEHGQTGERQLPFDNARRLLEQTTSSGSGEDCRPKIFSPNAERWLQAVGGPIPKRVIYPQVLPPDGTVCFNRDWNIDRGTPAEVAQRPQDFDTRFLFYQIGSSRHPGTRENPHPLVRMVLSDPRKVTTSPLRFQDYATREADFRKALLPPVFFSSSDHTVSFYRVVLRGYRGPVVAIATVAQSDDGLLDVWARMPLEGGMVLDVHLPTAYSGGAAEEVANRLLGGLFHIER